MNLEDKASIIIYKKNQLWRFRLVCVNNDETVGTGKGYTSLSQLYQDLYFATDFCFKHDWTNVIYIDKKKQYRFRIGSKFRVVVRSEPYTQKHNAESGIESCRIALQTGRVALEFSEDTNIWDLKALIADPTLGIVQT